MNTWNIKDTSRRVIINQELRHSKLSKNKKKIKIENIIKIKLYLNKFRKLENKIS